MNIKRQNPILFLGMLVGFALLSLQVVNTFTIKPVIGETKSGTSAVSQSLIGAPVDVVQDDGTTTRIIEAQGYAPAAISYNEDGELELEEVLGCGDGSGSPTGCSVGAGIIYQPICSRGDTEVVVGDAEEVGQGGGGVQVTKNSKIEVWEVTVPMALLSGSHYVKDSRMAIGNADEGFQGTFKPAYNIISDQEARSFCIPGLEGEYSGGCIGYDENVADAPIDAYYVNVHAEMEEEPTNFPEPDKAVITPKLKSACPKVQLSKPNPIRTNRRGRWIEGNFQLPTEHSFMRNFRSVQCLKASNQGIEVSNHVACLEKRTSFNFLVYATVKIQDWIDCTIGSYNKETGEWEDPDPELCKESVLTGLKIDGLFGSTFKCFRNHCSSRYMDLTRQGTTIPVDASARAPEGLTPTFNQPVVEPLYVTTPCKVRVDGVNIEDVPCLWDVSVYEADYERQKQASYPGDPNIPATFEEYWKMVEDQIAGRGEQCS